MNNRGNCAIIEGKRLKKIVSSSPSKATKETTMILSQCKHITCNNPKNGGYGYCKTHSMRFWRGQDLDMKSVQQRRKAIIEGDKAKIPLGLDAKYGYALVDTKDVALIENHNWSLGLRGYPTKGKGKTLHHVIMGKPIKGQVVDHINRDKLDNRRSNLRFVNAKDNARNISMQKNNTSGYRGVWFRKDTEKWVANIKVDYIKISLGCYTSKEKAAIAYNNAAKKYFGDFAVLNKVQSI